VSGNVMYAEDIVTRHFPDFYPFQRISASDFLM
jgi:hypothetical protein